MCLAVPAKILEIYKGIAKANMNGVIINASIELLENVKPGEYILIHTGIAIERLDKEEALETLRIIDQLNDD